MGQRPHVLLRSFEFHILFPLSIVFFITSVVYFFGRSWGTGAFFLFVAIGVGGIGQSLPHRKRQSVKELGSGKWIEERYGEISSEESRSLAKAMMWTTLLIALVAAETAIHRSLSVLWVLIYFISSLILFPVCSFVVVLGWSFILEKIHGRQTRQAGPQTRR
jgi:predicted PurR-regulated permease PerM